MPGIFRLNKDASVVLTPEAKDLCQRLSELDAKNFLYVILVYDTMDSPYRRKPLEERQNIAKNRIWGTPEHFPELDSRVAEAIEELSSIVYDHNQEQRDVLLTKLRLLNQDLIAADPSKVKSLLDAIEMLEIRIEKLDTKMDQEEEAAVLKGERRLSLVEKFIRNRQAYTDKMKSYGIGN